MTANDRHRARGAWKLFILAAWAACFALVGLAGLRAQPPPNATAIFAGGCFWSMEHVFDELPGVTSVTVGYTGGAAKRPTYEQVEAGITGHVESVQVAYDSTKTSYDALLDAYWHNTDPSDGAGQFCDTGSQYRPVIFFADAAQQHAAEKSKSAIEQSGHFKRVLTRIQPATTFWPAEAYHQHYYKTHAAAYTMYRIGCGRDARLKTLWR